MKVVLGGVRGSRVVAGAEYTTYGGDSTCILVEGDNGARVILDGGSGLHRIAAQCAPDGGGGEALILCTHYHIDHLLGIPQCPLLYRRKWSLTVAAPLIGGRTVEAVLPMVFGPPLWPVSFEDVAARVGFLTLGDGGMPFVHGDLTVRWCPLHHAGGCVAYRIDAPAAAQSVVLATDMEWAAADEEERERLLVLIRDPTPASVVCIDGQFDTHSYAAHRGWGHSSWEDALEIATQAQAGRLVVVHHDPGATDAMLAAREAQLQGLHEHASFGRAGARIL